MPTFQFQITQQYVNDCFKITSPYWVEVAYYVVNDKVVVTNVKVPYTILTYLTGYHLANDIYFAAENNYASIAPVAKPDIFKQMVNPDIDIFSEINKAFNLQTAQP